MIRLYLNDKDALQRWYADLVVPHILKKRVNTAPFNPQCDILFQHLDTLPEWEIRDILLLPPEELQARYFWIAEYVDLCDACNAYQSLHDSCPKGDRTAARKARESYIATYQKNAYLREIFCSGDGRQAIQSWRQMDALMAKAAEILAEVNGRIQEKFSYSFLDELGLRGTLVQKMNIPVCPYCNKQYIQPVTTVGQTRYLGDIDHILPRSLYPLFSLSLWNLTPCCKSCNQIFKRANTANLLNPHIRGFDSDCILTLNYQTVRELVGLEPVREMRWEIRPGLSPDVREQIENNLRVFQLDASYDYHRKDIRLALQRRYLMESSAYRSFLSQFTGGMVDPMLIYGVSLDPSRFQEELLSKAIYDALTYN